MCAVAGVAGAHPLNVFDDFSALLKPRVCILKLQAALLQQLTDKSTNPATLAEDQEHLQNVFTLKRKLGRATRFCQS